MEIIQKILFLSFNKININFIKKIDLKYLYHYKSFFYFYKKFNLQSEKNIQK